MARSLWKGPVLRKSLVNAVKKVVEKGKQDGPITVYCRYVDIIPMFVGIVFAVHNGKIFNTVRVTADMVGYKFGDFSPTRTFRGHPGTKKVSLR